MTTIILPRRPGAQHNLLQKPNLGLPPGLVGRWLLNEKTIETAYDISGWRSHGTAGGSSLPILAPGPFSDTCWEFDGIATTGSYVTLGGAPVQLGLSRYTLSCWFYRTGNGDQTSIGTGGITDMIPLVTHGRGEADGSNVDCNWALGISDTTDVIACDFEDIDGTPTSGVNRPVSGSTTIQNNVWYHAAGTWDGVSHRVWLNGELDGSADYINQPRWDSVQHVGIATAMTSTGARDGFFAGRIADVQIYDRALNQQQIRQIIGNPYRGFLQPSYLANIDGAKQRPNSSGYFAEMNGGFV